jgi:predicted NodU family carbamoyl transferase
MPINLADPVHFDAAYAQAAASEAYRTLQARIAQKTAAVTVCGMGYVGLPLSRAIPEQGFRVVGLDIDTDGKGLGWFQGRMEFGPRALGNRSIIADARCSLCNRPLI